MTDPTPRTVGRSLALAACLTGSALSAQDDGPVSFNRDVRPLLADRCFHCHGPDPQERKAGLRLDRPHGAEGAYRVRRGKAAVRPGSIEKSELWRRVNLPSGKKAMPPRDSHKAPLTVAERDILRRWILQGAAYETHWAFVPPRRPAPAETRDPRWSGRSIDSYVRRRLESLGLQPSPGADRRTLIRRVTLDLTGLPPTRAAIHAFLADDRPDAYERLVDHLLAQPQYGEHMARYWLDLVRFADTNGVHHDHYRDMSPYRDWVIRAFNSNLPYDRFVRDQLAGDLVAAPTSDQQIASGFHRLHLIIDRGTALPEESLARNVIDRVTAFGTAFLGLTVQCAVCHDHKYDPITQKDFYQLYAFFNNIDAAPETGRRGTSEFRRGLQPPYLEFPSPRQSARLAEVERRRTSLRSRIRALQEDTAEHKNDELLADLRRWREILQCVDEERHGIAAEIPAAMVMKERRSIRPTHIFVRGDYATLGPPVERNTPAFLPPMRATAGVRTRLDLASWLLDPSHPLTARVAVNRIWQQFFGVGIVKTAEDFGTQGEWPSHPELLDLLATEFVASGWDIQALVRRIVTSATYRQRSKAPEEAFVLDPQNRRLARGSRFRLDAEVLRDQILASSGLLSPTMFGRSVHPPQPKGIWKAVTLPDSLPRVHVPDVGERARRRSVYTFWKRGMPPPQMTIFNAPTRESCVARRERTNTPLQALLLLNEGQFLQAARTLAARTLAGSSADDAARIDAIYETVTAHLPDAAERRTLLRALHDLRTTYRQRPAAARELCADTTPPPGSDAATLAAWTMLASTIYNLDVTKTRD